MIFEAVNDDAQPETKLATASVGFSNNRRVAQGKPERSRAAAPMRERSQEITGVTMLAMSRLIRQSVGEVAPSAPVADRYVGHVELFPVPAKPAAAKRRTVVEREPSGVLVGVEICHSPDYRIARVAVAKLMAAEIPATRFVHASHHPTQGRPTSPVRARRSGCTEFTLALA